MFNLELLQAISDWQRGGDLKQKARRGERLKILSEALDPEFRETSLCCFRQISLDKSFLWKLGNELHIKEGISSWTMVTDVAKEFKGGPPPEGWQGVIFEIVPEGGQVILNIDALFRDPHFLEDCEAAKGDIVGFHEGIGRYSGSQREVVLEVKSLPIEAVYALGGHSSTKESLARMYFGREPSAGELKYFYNLLVRSKAKFGPVWVTEDAMTRVRSQMLKQVEVLKSLVSDPEEAVSSEEGAPANPALAPDG
jgi:hypothetical protein